jgi:hypothetical protein
MTDSTNNSMKNSMQTSVTRFLTAGLLVSASLTNANFAHAASNAQDTQVTPITAQDSDPYFQLQSMTIEEIPETADSEFSATLNAMTASPEAGIQSVGKAAGKVAQVAGTIADISNIVNAGQLVWSIIEANKPSARTTSDVANAIPKGADWSSLVGWSAPQSRAFHVNYKNSLGGNAVDFTYHVIYLYGGNVAGKGHFLNGVTIVPANVTVAWGYTFTAQAKVASVTNSGTVANPMAAMEIQMQWSVSNMLKSTEQTQSYYVRGDGQFQELN